jgi:bacteriorhodopsin
VIFLTAFGFIGFLLSARQLIKQRDDLSNSTFWRTAWLVALLTIAAVVKNGLTTIASQGRFLFPAIGALSLLMVYGWYQIFSEKIQNRLPMIVTVFMVSCNLIVWQFAVLPIYFQPFLD